MNVNVHILRDISEPMLRPLNTLGLRDFTSNPDWKRNLISFTSLLWDNARKCVICGLTAFDNDIFYEFYPVENKFKSIGYPTVAEQYEIKIHRSLVFDPDGSVIAGYGECYLFAYDCNSNSFQTWRPIHDNEKKAVLFIGHDMCFSDDGNIFIGETDTQNCAAYLWKITDLV